ncbi:MAG TPA: ATP phosphoribosyltransferase regulatory subunit [Clostridia bacterium]|nr:ATP phosphoribosyltransferase regulatory subunit [Clostridia bacterium]
MKFDISALKKDEQVALTMRKIFESFGYRKYKMSRFEEYGFYMDYKSFLPSDRVISFTDIDGKLLALKPDVTLSIVKNAKDLKDGIEKLYYVENVYKPDKNSGKFKEISQLGLEAMGDVDDYTTLEVINLAVKSLEELEDDFVLDISHIGIVMGLLESEEMAGCGCKDKVLEYIVSKNVHDLEKTLASEGVLPETIEKFRKLVTITGSLKSLGEVEKIVANEEMERGYRELVSVAKALDGSGCENRINLDFSIINDVNYYCGIIFQGYVRRIPHMVLSGGRYDKLLQKLGKRVGAIGFALILDELSAYYPEERIVDADALILYDDAVNPAVLYRAAEELTFKGLKVRVENAVPADIKVGKVYKFNGVKLEEANV